MKLSDDDNLHYKRPAGLLGRREGNSKGGSGESKERYKGGREERNQTGDGQTFYGQMYMAVFLLVTTQSYRNN